MGLLIGFQQLNSRILQPTNGSRLEAVLLPVFKGAFGNTWVHVGLSQLGGGDGTCSRHLVGLWMLLNIPKCTGGPLPLTGQPRVPAVPRWGNEP